MPTAKQLWREMDGKRVTAQFRICLYCDGRDGILRQHHCRDELELYCDWCERWTGLRITYQQVQAWVGEGPDKAEGGFNLNCLSRVSRLNFHLQDTSGHLSKRGEVSRSDVPQNRALV